MAFVIYGSLLEKKITLLYHISAQNVLYPSTTSLYIIYSERARSILFSSHVSDLPHRPEAIQVQLNLEIVICIIFTTYITAIKHTVVHYEVHISNTIVR